MDVILCVSVLEHLWNPLAALEACRRIVRPGGRVVLLGLAGEGKMLELPANRIMLGDIDVVGSCSYSTAAWSSVLRLLERDAVDLEPIVTHRFPAHRFAEAFAVLDERREAVTKVLLEHVPAT